MHLLTAHDAIRLLGLDRSGLRQPCEALRWLRRTGRLRYVRVGRRAMYRAEWIDDYIEAHATRGRRYCGDSGRQSLPEAADY